MSADSENPEDDLIFDDEDFPADEPADKAFFGEAEGEGGQVPDGEDIGQVFDENRPQSSAPSGYSGDEDESLFADQSVQGQPTETFSSGREFSEESGASWGGKHMDLEDLGIPMDDDTDPLKSDADQEFDLDAEGEELQLVEHESELYVPDSDAADADMQYGVPGGEHEGDAADTQYVLSEEEHESEVDTQYGLPAEEGADADMQYVLSEEEGADADMQYVLSEEEHASDAGETQYALSEEESDEWAPVLAEGEMEAGDEGYAQADEQDPIYAAEPQQEYAAEGEPDYAEYEESYVEGHEGYETAEVQPRRRFRLVSVASGLAAACLLVAAGTVVVMKPELFGLKVEPSLVDVVQIDRPGIDLTLAAPVLEPVAVTPDPVVPDPVIPDPVIPDPVIPDPVVPDPVVPDPGATTPEPTVGPDSGPIQLGESGMAIGEFTEEEIARAEHPLTAGVSPGSQAFAQLKNGNFFIGKVKTVNAPLDVTLTVENGEVTLALAELRTLASLGSDEYLELQRAEKGYVRLSNNNLLRGTILSYGRDDNVILEMKANQVLIPRSAIEEMGNTSSDSVIHLDDSADSDWVRRLVEEEMVRDSGPNPLGENKEPEGLETLPLPGVKRDR